MFVKVGVAGEGLGTDGALEGAVPEVDVHVLLEHGGLHEALAAHTARVGSES